MSIISAYRTLRNANLPEDFPVIDDVNLDAKTVTKMEVLNLVAPEHQDRYLELGIPAGKATQAQVEKLVELQEYAQTKDVTLVIIEVP